MNEHKEVIFTDLDVGSRSSHTGEAMTTVSFNTVGIVWFCWYFEFK